MRRSHPRVWDEVPRHFNPRPLGPRGFGPPRNYPQPLLNTPSFPGPPFAGGRPPFSGPPHHASDGHQPFTRRPYGPRGPNKNFNYQPHHNDRHEQREHFHERRDHQDHREPYNERTRINRMGDIDHRNYPPKPMEPGYSHPISPWTHDGPRSRSFEERRDQRYYRPEEPQHETHKYTGHRPPSSDHYEGQTTSNVEISESFSHSVDDTVDIVRRKLMHRSDPTNHPIETETLPSMNIDSVQEPESMSYEKEPGSDMSKKKSSKPRSNIKTDCDKIKNKIVHQLFKMDKGRIHKLMDNPNSSHKFEFAIKSLITESQNSLNRHVRSNAEKSLYGASNDLSQYNNDNDAIYEDTFMRQMQGILDPQDTILLEDIKPIVLAELNKVLHLDNFNFPQDSYNNEAFYNEHGHYSQDSYPQQHEQYENQEHLSYEEEQNYRDHGQSYYPDDPEQNQFVETRENAHPYDPISPDATIGSQESQESTMQDFSPKVSPPKKELEPATTPPEIRRRKSAELGLNTSAFSVGSSIDNIFTNPSETPEKPKNSANEPPPLFNTTASDDDEYTFAELDKQYHVAVDRSYIMDDLDTTHISSSNLPKHSGLEADINKGKIRELPKIEIKPLAALQNAEVPKISEMNIKKELIGEINSTTNNFNLPDVTVKQEKHHSKKHFEEEPQKPDSSGRNSPEKPSRRSSEKPSLHRKERRKRSESPETKKKILNKNIIINVSDCVKKSEKCDASGKSVFNLFFSKEKRSGDNKESKKSESERHDKKKDRDKSKDKSSEKKRNSSTSNHNSTTSPKGSSTSSSTSATPNKNKFTAIDIFSKGTPATSSTVKTVPIKSISKQITRRHVSTQCLAKGHSKETQTNITKSCTTRFCQTERRGISVKAIQTDPTVFDKTTKKSTDPFERMKEIDLEIQILVQEKFKLYNSMESKDACGNVGMTVLNMPADDETNDKPESNEDAIVDDFTNIPDEELTQIALESVSSCRTPRSTKRSHSKTKKTPPSTKKRKEVKRTNKKSDTPNISLIEQIIADDRPLEEIISLEDLEEEEEPPLRRKCKRKVNAKRTEIVRPKENIRKNRSDSQTIHVELSESAKIQLFKKYNIKPCSVVVTQQNFCKQKQKPLTPVKEEVVPETKEVVINKKRKLEVKEKSESPKKKVKRESKPKANEHKQSKDIIIEIAEDEVSEKVTNEIIEEAVITGNEIHFQDDMLEVSEDIVISEVGPDNTGAKEISGSIEEPVEEVVVDNSQSEDDIPPEDVAQKSPSACRMYDFSADEDLKHDAIECQGNGDAVLALECINNNFLAACLDGNVYYYSCDGKLLNTLRGSNFAVTCLTIVKEKFGTTVYTGSLDSRIRSYDIETCTEKGPECNVLSPIQSMDCAWGSVFVGTRTGFVLQFECKNHMLIPVSTIKFSEQSILALRALKEGPRKVLLVAPRSENVTIKDAQTGLLLRSLVGPKMTVYTLLYEDGKVFCGTSTNQIQIFDYASGSHIGEHEGGKGAVCLRACGGLIYAGCYDGCVYVFRPGEAKPFAQLRGPSMLLLSLAVVCGKIIVGYKDRSLYIWKIPESILNEMIL